MWDGAVHCPELWWTWSRLRPLVLVSLALLVRMLAMHVLSRTGPSLQNAIGKLMAHSVAEMAAPLAAANDLSRVLAPG